MAKVSQMLWRAYLKGRQTDLSAKDLKFWHHSRCTKLWLSDNQRWDCSTPGRMMKMKCQLTFLLYHQKWGFTNWSLCHLGKWSTVASVPCEHRESGVPKNHCFSFKVTDDQNLHGGRSAEVNGVLCCMTVWSAGITQEVSGQVIWSQRATWVLEGQLQTASWWDGFRVHRSTAFARNGKHTRAEVEEAAALWDDWDPGGVLCVVCLDKTLYTSSGDNHQSQALNRAERMYHSVAKLGRMNFFLGRLGLGCHRIRQQNVQKEERRREEFALAFLMATGNHLSSGWTSTACRAGRWLRVGTAGPKQRLCLFQNFAQAHFFRLGGSTGQRKACTSRGF